MGQEKIYEICKIKDAAICWMNTAIGQGMDCLDAKEVGEVADIIKDMCESEKYIMESEYYKKVGKAMDEESEKPEWMDPMGYTPSRPMRNTNGRTHMPPSYGYTPPYRPYVDQEPYIDAYLGKMDKRWYTPEHEIADGWTVKPENGKYTTRHLDKLMDNLSDMWDDSEPDLRMKIKNELTELISKMSV